MPLHFSTGERLRVARLAAGFRRQADAVEAAKAVARDHGLDPRGLSAMSVSRYERGESEPGADLVRVLACVYGVKVVDLLPDLTPSAKGP